MADRVEPKLVNYWLVKAHIIASLIFFFVGLASGFLFSLQFIREYIGVGVELLSPGRVRMVHTNMLAYGFIANAFFSGLYWVVPRLTGVPVFSEWLSKFLFWVWQLILLLTFVGLMTGFAQGVEWGETPILVDPLVVVGVVLMAINFYVPILKTKEKALYVTLWYFSVAFVWTGLNYIMGNYLPQFWVPGAAGAAITGLFIHDLVGLFVTPLGWGLMYFFVPVILKKPIWSHALSLVGFWALAFFYPLNGVHHYLWSPIPMYLQYGAVTSTVAVEIVVSTVIVNFFMTLKGSGDMLRTSIPLRWFYAGMIFYFITCLQCAFHVFLTVQEIIHFTDWVVGHAHLVMFGVFGFWILGVMTELWPKLVGRDWYSHKLNEYHFWLTAIGTLVMFVDLMAAGLVQGFLWRGLAPWEDSITFSIPFWMIRTVTGAMIFFAQFLFVYNMWRTAKAPAVEMSPELQPQAA
ncbi:MAG: Cytochrome c oxidase subunit I-like protein [Bacteroidetes bacterium]|nr:Cytochrome c oxidase subunit I-like protein [Bacteroidota bacterium]